MKEQNTKRLLKRYPKIFKEYYKPMTETCMCWGFECGDGWYPLINSLCDSLQFDTDNNGFPQVVASQVKEKYGTLRFYYNIESSEDEYYENKCGSQEGKIRFAELLSGYICETCGSNDRVEQTKGWIVTLCHKCMEKYNAKRKS